MNFLSPILNLTDPRRRKAAIALAVVIGAVALLVIAASLTTSAPAAPSRTAPESRSFEVGIPTLQKVEAFVSGYGSRVEATEAELARIRTELEETRKSLKESLAELAKSRTEDAGLVHSALDSIKGGPDAQQNAAAMVARVRRFDFPAAPDAVPKGRQVHIPAGSLGEATLLTGLFAPVAGEALPVHARLDATVIGPNRTRIPISGAFLVGRAQGDPNASRVIVQFHKLAFVTSKGESIEAAINADVADSDGTLGLSGRYVWRVDEVLPLAGLAGGTSGFAEALSAREVSTTISPLGGGTSVLTGDAMKLAGSRGASRGLERISEAVAKRIEEIQPAVWVPNGRKATILFLDGVTLDGLSTSEVTREADLRSNRYRGLDFDR